jgi:hypothetical protein
MFKLLFLCLCVLGTLPLQAVQANADSLTRRLFLDLYDRIPTIDESTKAMAYIEAGKYETLVNIMMQDDEYLMTLASKMVKHYAPPKAIRTHNFLSYKRLEGHIKSTYLGKKNDFRKFLGDMIEARGIAATNPMVLFYSIEEDEPLMTARFSAQVLGVPIKCAQCHDHKIHPDIVVNDFWSMAAFYKGIKVSLVGDLQTLKKFEKDFKSKKKDKPVYSKQESTDISNWIDLELSEKSIYDSFSNEELLGQSMSHGLTKSAVNKARLKRDDKVMLKAPQLMISEKKTNLKSLKIDYELDGKQYTSTVSQFKRDRKLNEKALPRDVLSQWMAWKEPLYISRATANWVTNWLFGRGWIMPAYDTYKVEGPNATKLDNLAQGFMRSKFNIHFLVKTVLMSNYYRMKSNIKNDEEKFAFFKARRMRHLSGNQIVNSLNRTPKDILGEAKSAQDGTDKLYKIAIYKNSLVEKIFPVSLEDSEASYRGTLTQALKLSTDSIFLKYTNKLAEISYKRFRNHTVEQLLDYLFVKLYTRKPTKNEIVFFKAKIDFSKNYRESGVFETTWTIINSPEMRLY